MTIELVREIMRQKEQGRGRSVDQVHFLQKEELWVRRELQGRRAATGEGGVSLIYVHLLQFK